MKKRSSLVSMMTKEAFLAAPKIQIQDDGQTPKSQKISINGSDYSENNKHYKDNMAGYKTHYAAIANA